MLRGLAVYFWVDRYRRKLAIREKVSVLPVLFVWFFNSVLFFNLCGCSVLGKTAFDCSSKLGFILFTFGIGHYIFPIRYAIPITSVNVASGCLINSSAFSLSAIICPLPGIINFQQLQCYLFATGALVYIYAKVLLHAQLNG